MGVLLLLVGVAVGAFGLFQHLKGKRILAAPFKKTGELAKNPTSSDPKGAMSTEGKVIAPAQQLLSPCTQQPCLAYEVKVERLWEKVETTQDGTKTVKGSDTLDTLKGGAVFSVDDGSGAVQIDVSKGADFDNFKDGFKKELNGRGWASQIQFGELSYDVPVISDSEKYTIGFKATEKYVPAEGSLFVLGKIEGGKIVKPGWRSMMTSSKGRDGLIGSINTKKKVSFIGGGVAALLSVPLMIFGPSLSDGASSGPSDPNHGFGGSCASTLTGAVSKCSGMVSNKEGESYTWTVTRKDTYELAALPAKGKKYTLNPQLIVERDGEELANVEGYGEAAKTSLELEPGTYSLQVKSVGGYVIKGGFSFDLKIDAQNPEPVAAPLVAEGDDAAPVSKKDALKAKLAALKAKKAGKAAPAPVAEPVVEAPVAVVTVEDAFDIRDGVASCNLPSNSSCTEYPAHTVASKLGCEMFKGEYAKKPCSRENTVGACVMKSGDVSLLYAGGAMGLSRKTAVIMCPKNMGQLALAPEEAPSESPVKVADLQPVVVPEIDLTPAPVEPEPVQEPLAAAEPELEISAKNLTSLSVEMNKDCGSMHCKRGFQYIFTNLSCDKTARWCQLDVTAMERASHETFVATLPFTPAAKTRWAFDAATDEALRAFEDAPKSGRLAAVVMQAEKKPVVAVAAKRVVVAEPLAKKSAPVAARTVAVAPKAQPAPIAAPAPAPAPVKAASIKTSSSAAPVMQRANKNMAD
ncbi:MAG: GIDE domain-containing protein [Myxococcales bacterium]|nr:GIDE domain-containing protein [Myxococcales bacterium]